jgi:septal ring factor EnvC (AmiA/AmiB activator)
MPIDTSHIISALSLLIAAFALYRNVRGDTKTDAGQLTTLIVKLETIGDDTKEIKNDIKDVKVDMDRMKEKLTLAEASEKQAHKRIDTLQGLVLHEYKTEEENSST